MMTTIVNHPVTGSAAWHGEKISSTGGWIVHLEPAHLEEIASAVDATKKRALELLDIKAEDFPLPRLAALITDLQSELEMGRGFALIRAIPVERCGKEEITAAFWGLGNHIGTPEPQDRAGNLLHHVRDTGLDLAQNDNLRLYQTNQTIPYHNDGSDVFMLLCIQPAKRGGRSLLISAVTVFNEILRRRADLAEVLQQPFYFDARGQQADGLPRYQAVPIFNIFEGRLHVIYKRDYIDLAQRFDEVPPLSERQIEALDLLDEICNESDFALEFDMQAGDILLANNYQLLHSRTVFEDYEDPDHRRHMLRLWLTLPNGRALPPVFEHTREFCHSYARRTRSGGFQPPSV
jgi:hypothetical protein